MIPVLDLVVQELPDALSEGPGAAFYAGVLAAVWIFERAVSYALAFQKKEMTPENVAKAVHQQLTATELEAMKGAVEDVVEEQVREFRPKFAELYDWHNREDPDRPGWKIWWVSSRDFRKLLEVAERQTQLDGELLASLDRQAELARMLMGTLETITRVSGQAAADSAAARAGVEELVARNPETGGGPPA